MTSAVATHIATTIIAAIQSDPSIARDVEKMTAIIVQIEKVAGPALTREIEQWVEQETQKICCCCPKKK